MATPSYGTIIAHPEYGNLSQQQKQSVAQQYWKDYPRMEREALALTAEISPDATPVQQRLDAERKKVAALELAYAEPEAEQYKEQLDTGLASANESYRKVNQLYTDEGNQVLNNLTDLGRRTNLFGSAPTMEFIGGDIEANNQQYAETRNTIVENFGITPEEADDVVKHRLDRQEAPVSRDATGQVHIKNNLLFQPKDEIEKAIKGSGLPESIKNRELEGLDDKLMAFKTNVVESTIKQHPEFAENNGIFKGFNNRTVDENFKLIGEAISSGRLENEAAGIAGAALESGSDLVNLAASGAAEAAGFRGQTIAPVAGVAADMDRASNAFKSQVALSNDIKGEALKIFGATGGVVGQGLYSVGESVVLAAATGGLVPTFSGASRLAMAANRLAKVAPVASIMGLKQGAQVEEQALQAGKSPEEARELAITSGVTETVVTALSSFIGFGGPEDFASGAAKATIRKALSPVAQGFKAAGKSFAGENVEELTIAITDALAVQSRINPNMTGEDLRKIVTDTVVATSLASGGFAGAEGLNVASEQATYNKTTPELERDANQIAKENLPPLENEGGAVAEGSPEALAEDRARLSEQAAGLVPESEARVALEERIAEIDEELSQLPSSQEGLGAGAATTSQEAIESPTAPAVGNPIETTPPVTEVDQPIEIDETTPNPRSDQGTGVETTPDIGSYEESRANDKAAHREANAKLGKFGEDLNSLEQKWEDSNVNLKLSQTKDGNIELDVVRIPESEQRKGLGSKVLTDIKELSDATGKPVELLPVPIGSNTVEDLERFYERNGFTPYDRGVTPSGRQRQRGYRYEPKTVTTPVTSPVTETTQAVEPPVVPVESSGDTNTNSTEISNPPVVPPAPPIPTEERRSISATNASVDRSLKELGLPGITKRAPQGLRQWWDNAVKVSKEDPSRGPRLAQEITTKPRSGTMEEQGILLHEIARTEIQAVKRQKAINAATDPVVRQTLYEQLMKDRTELIQATTASNIMGSEAGRVLRSRQVSVDQDYNLVSMQTRVQAEVNEGENLRPDQEKTIQELHNRIKQAEEELAVVAMETEARVRDEMERNALSKISKAKNKKETLDRQIADARKRMASRKNTDQTRLFSASFDQEDIIDAAIIAQAYIRKGVVSLTEFTKELVREFGQTAEPFAERVFERSKELLAQSGLIKTPAQLLAEIDPSKPLNRQTVYNMVKAYVQDGLAGKAAVDRTHKDLQGVWSGITREEVSDAFTGYGRQINPTRNELRDELNNIRKIEGLQRRIDGRNKPGVKRTKKDSEEVARLKAELKELIKTTKVVTPKDPVASAKSRLRKEIDTLETAVKNNELILKPQRTVETDAELEALKEQAKQARRDYDEAFPEQGTQLTPNQEIDRVVKALDKQIEREEKGIVKDLKDFSWFSPQISERRRVLDEKRAAKNELRWTENAEKSARAAIARAEEIIRTGKLPEPKSGPQRTPTQNLQVLWDTRNELQGVVAQMRRDSTVDARALKSAQDSIKELERRIAEKDFSTKPRKTTTNADVLAARALRKELQKTFQRLKNPPKSAEERLAEAIQKRTEAIRERIAKGDFSKEVRPKREESERIQKARLEEAKAKEDWNKLFFENELKKQTKLQKFGRIVVEPINVSRTLKTILDLPPIFRQGMLVTLTRPITSLRNAGKGFVSGLSADKAKVIENTLRDHPDYQLAKAAKLSLTESGSYASLSAQEEEFRGAWAKKIPIVSRAVNFSERNYVAYLNGLRMDLFSSMVNSMSLTGKPSVEEAKVIADFVNAATGRGSLGKMEAAAPALSAIFFSPRYWASRINTIMGVFPATFDVVTGFKFRSQDVVRARKAIAKEYARMMVGYGLFYGALYMAAAGFDDEEDKFAIELDPRSSDFGKVKVGKARFDPLAGMASNLVFVSRFLTGTSKSARDGKVTTKEGQGFVGLVATFLRGKLAPLPGSVINYQAGQDIVGKRTTLRNELVGLFLPMSPGDIKEQLEEFGPAAGLGTSMLVLLGMGAQVHDDNLTLQQQIALALGDEPEDFAKKRKRTKGFSLR